MSEHALVIYNPHAGKGLFKDKLSYCVDLLTKGGYRVEVYPTQAKADAIYRIMNLEPEFSLVVAAGGDGTLDEVVTGMLKGGHSVPIGYIPVGSTNDYASTLGISQDIIEAVGCVMGGRPRPIDIGTFNSRYFVYVAAFGAFTDVSYATPQDMKNTFGYAAYMMEAAKRLGDIKPIHVKADIDGEAVEGDYVFGMISNSISVAGMKNPVDKAVLLDDGLFEVTFIKNPGNIFDLRDIVGGLILGSSDSPLFETFQGRRIAMELDREVKWTLDGEYGGTLAEVRAECLKGAVSMVLEDDLHSVLTPQEE